MKRFLTTSFILLALVLAAGAAPAVHANPGDTCQDANGNYLKDANGNDLIEGNDGKCAIQGATTVGTQPDGTTNDPAAEKTPKPFVAPEANSTDSEYGGLMIRVMSLFAWLVGAAAVTLDYAVYFTVVKMGNYVNDLAAVGVTWRILRDIGNIVLIFGFLAAGIMTIMNVEWLGYGKKMLPMLLVAAVFLNFSLFLSEAVIDTGNLFATQFYKQIKGGTLPTAESLKVSNISNAIERDGISSKIMSQLGLPTIYGAALKQDPKILGQGNQWYIGFIGIIVFMITAFTLFSLAFVLIARFVILLFLIIVAPIGFAGLAVPKLKETAGKWWHALFEQTITAPVLLLLLYIALAVITDTAFLSGIGSTSEPDFLGFIGPDNLSGFGSMLLSFLVAMGLLLAVVIISKKMSAVGAGFASKTAGALTGGVLGYGLLGGTSIVGRATLGSLGRWMSSQKAQAWASKSRWGKAAVSSGKFLANRTYDARNLIKVPGVGKAVGLATGALGGALAMSGAGEISSGLGSGATVTAQKAIDSSIEGWKTYNPYSGEWWRNQQKEYQQAANAQARKEAVKNAEVPTIPPNDKSTKVQDELKRMSVEELSALKEIRDASEKLVFNLSPEKFNELMKSDKLIPGEKDKLRDKWKEQFSNAKGAEIAMSRFSTEDIANLGGGILKNPNVVQNLGAAELDQIRRKANLSSADRKEMLNQMRAAAQTNQTFQSEMQDYFKPENDPGGNRAKYWGTSATSMNSGTLPPGYQTSPGSNFVVPTNFGGGPKKPPPPSSSSQIIMP